MDLHKGMLRLHGGHTRSGIKRYKKILIDNQSRDSFAFFILSLLSRMTIFMGTTSL